MIATDYKFKVYKFHKRTRPVHVTDFVCQSTSFRTALNIFMHTCHQYIDIWQNNVNSTDFSLFNARSLAGVTCRIDVYVKTVHHALSGQYLEYEPLTSFEL